MEKVQYMTDEWTVDDIISRFPHRIAVFIWKLPGIFHDVLFYISDYMLIRIYLETDPNEMVFFWSRGKTDFGNFKTKSKVSIIKNDRH